MRCARVRTQSQSGAWSAASASHALSSLMAGGRSSSLMARTITPQYRHSVCFVSFIFHLVGVGGWCFLSLSYPYYTARVSICKQIS